MSRSFFQQILLAATSVHLTSAALADEPEFTRTTYVYKTVGDLDVHADVYRAPGDEPRPVLVMIHGGALMLGNREGIDRRVRDAMLAAGFVVVSIDYRLAPETQLPEIIADVEDAFAWLRKDGTRLFQADVDNVVVTGGSAGGYLTLTAGHRVRPRPRALVAFFGYGDLVGDWYSTPSPHPRHHRSQLTPDEAWKQVSGPPLADSRDRPGDGGAFYQFCRQTGGWPKAVSGWDPHNEADRFAPYMPLRNVDGDYPPTLLIHGKADTDVPYEQSVLMDRELQAHGVTHQLITIEGAEHGLVDGDSAAIDAAYDAVPQFFLHHTASSR
ncbi:MAG: alpha/beta hydrolase [Planctomycetales bacterium]|nr:alpha/beta hydrolase [Planctomycetales bacterium]